jgi:hypothetical protein
MKITQSHVMLCHARLFCLFVFASKTNTHFHHIIQVTSYIVSPHTHLSLSPLIALRLISSVCSFLVLVLDADTVIAYILHCLDMSLSQHTRHIPLKNKRGNNERYESDAIAVTTTP